VQAIAATLVHVQHGAGTPALKKLTAHILDMDQPSEATVLAADLPSPRTGARYAALVNGVAAGTQDAGVTVPAVLAGLAAAELTGANGEEFLAAVLVGAEVAARMALALGITHEQRGWNLAGTAGRVGAGVTAARLLALPAESVVDALGYAATAAAGAAAPPGSVSGALIVGRAAADGVEAALLASAGLAGPPAPLEGRRGLFALEVGEDPRRAVDEIGHRWELRHRLAPGRPADQQRAWLAKTIESSQGDVATVVSACLRGFAYRTDGPIDIQTD
jgi:2-methylcitrate dehydratase PrpD